MGEPEGYGEMPLGAGYDMAVAQRCVRPSECRCQGRVRGRMQCFWSHHQLVTGSGVIDSHQLFFVRVSDVGDLRCAQSQEITTSEGEVGEGFWGLRSW